MQSQGYLVSSPVYLAQPQGMWGRRAEVSGFKAGLCKVSNLNKIEKISALWTVSVLLYEMSVIRSKVKCDLQCLIGCGPTFPKDRKAGNN